MALARFILTRLLLLIPVVWGVSTLVFALIHFIPGDPVQIMLGDMAQAADVQALRHALGLDKPLLVQYGDFMLGMVKGDLGRSLYFREPVVDVILRRYPATMQLAFCSMLVAVIIGILVGMLSAVKRGSLLDRIATFLAFLGISLPNFWLGPMLIIVFSIKLNLLPVSGMGTWKHLILPSITLGLGMAAFLTRITRSSMLDVLSEDYIRTAWAKGLSGTRIYLVHALRNSLIPIITVVALQFGALLAGSIITETIFSWPGIGRLTIQAINKRDFPLVQGCVFFIAMTYVAANLLADLLYGFLDPRIRLGKGEV